MLDCRLAKKRKMKHGREHDVLVRERNTGKSGQPGVVEKVTLKERCERSASSIVAGRIAAPRQPQPHTWDLCSLPSRPIDILQI